MIYLHKGARPRTSLPRVLDEETRRDVAAFEAFTKNVVFVAGTQEDWAKAKRKKRPREPG